MKKLPIKFYKRIVSAMPILCVDAIIIDKGKFLLIKRKNQPLKGKWWVPGGRVLKGERMEEALKRKMKEELGIDVKVLMPVGYYEEFYKETEFGVKNGIHTMSVAFLAIPLSLNIKLDSQSLAWKFVRNLPRDFKIKPFSFY